MCRYRIALRVECVTQNVLVKGACEVDVHQLPMIEGQTQDLTSKPEVVQMVWIYRGIAVGLKCGTCKIKIKNPHMHI